MAQGRCSGRYQLRRRARVHVVTPTSVVPLQLALVYGTPRSAGARAKKAGDADTRVVLWALEREVFRQVMAVLQIDQLDVTETFLTAKQVRACDI